MKYTKAPKNTGYLGHFKDCLKEGHNTSWRSKISTSVPEPKPQKKMPPPGGVRG